MGHQDQQNPDGHCRGPGLWGGDPDLHPSVVLSGAQAQSLNPKGGKAGCEPPLGPSICLFLLTSFFLAVVGRKWREGQRLGGGGALVYSIHDWFTENGGRGWIKSY